MGQTLVAALALVVAIGMQSVQAADSQSLQHNDGVEADTRQVVLVSPATRAMILTEMRGMLVAINTVLHGLASGDTDKAEKAALKTGMGAMQPGAQMAMRELPEGFRMLARSAHLGFDKLAAVLKSGGDKSAALNSVSDITDACVSCHAMYRFEERAARPAQ